MKRDQRTHNIWRSMRARCKNPKNISYPRYGARGISVCARWEKFEAFVEDMGYAPAGMTLERRHNNKPYSPTNCLWATPKQQARNRSNNVLLKYRGKTRPMSEWAEIAGLDRGTLWRRLKRGASLEVAMTRELCRGKPLTGKQKPRSYKKEAA